VSWLQLTLTAPNTLAAQLEIILEEHGAEAIIFRDAADSPILEPALATTPLWAMVYLQALFTDNTANNAVVHQLATQLAPVTLQPPHIEHIQERVWERAWLDYARPLQFGQRLWVIPSTYMTNSGQNQVLDQANAAVVVELDPGLAFGTGDHETTALCLQWLDRQQLTGKTVVDYGCGSGILALAALKLGAEQVLAIDHDPQALEATRSNADRNQVGAQVHVCLAADAKPEQWPADIVIANILAAPLITLAPQLLSFLKVGGALALSGILTSQAQSVCAAYQQNVVFEPPETKNDWVLVTGQRITARSNAAKPSADNADASG
jgi:ribosomal protein L11 methyltransferase